MSKYFSRNKSSTLKVTLLSPSVVSITDKETFVSTHKSTLRLFIVNKISCVLIRLRNNRNISYVTFDDQRARISKLSNHGRPRRAPFRVAGKIISVTMF